MKRFFFTIIALVIAGAVALAAYPMVSPYHARLRAQFKDPTKREQAIHQAVDFERTHFRAITGDAQEQYKLGLVFMSGDLGFKDTTQAVHWFRKSADKGYPLSEFAMAHYYFIGDGGLSKDVVEGANWTQKAAQSNVPQAQDLLGLLFVGAIGIEPQDLMEGLGYLKKARLSGAMQISIDIDEKMKAAYALPKEQQPDAVKKASDEAKTEAREQFPLLEHQLAADALVAPAAAPAPAQ